MGYLGMSLCYGAAQIARSCVLLLMKCISVANNQCKHASACHFARNQTLLPSGWARGDKNCGISERISCKTTAIWYCGKDRIV
jgi:hypothetical protein